MPSHEFTAAFGDQTKNVSISIDRYGSSHYAVYIDRFFRGSVYFDDNRWKGNFNQDSADITSDDIAILGQIIEENYLKFEDW